MTQHLANYQHDFYGEYNPDPADEWRDTKPQVKKEEILGLIAQMVDATDLEVQHGILKIYCEFGVLKWMKKAQWMDEDIKDDFALMKTEYDRLTRDLKVIHEKNHNIAMAVGLGKTNRDGNADASRYGISHYSDDGEHGFHSRHHHGDIHGAGMPYRDQHHYERHRNGGGFASTALKGMAQRATGIPFLAMGGGGRGYEDDYYDDGY